MVQVEHPAVPKTMEFAGPPVQVELEILIPRVFHVHGAMHVAHQVHEVFDRHQHRRIVQAAVILQPGDRLLDALHRIALCVGNVLSVGVDRIAVPARSHLVSRRMAVHIHPRGIIDDRTAVEVFLDVLPGLGRQVALGDISDGVMPRLAPAECRTTIAKEHCSQQKKTFLHN